MTPLLEHGQTEGPFPVAGMTPLQVGTQWGHQKEQRLGSYTAGLSLFLKLIYFNWRLITILWWFLPYIDMNQPWVYMCPPS